MLIPQKRAIATRKSRIEALVALAEQLPEDALITLQEFAEFLSAKHPPEENQEPDIVPIPRPEDEGVIPAIKRLSKTYPMLDKRVLFEQTSATMSAHVLNEVSARESIDRLEKVFRKEYELFVEKRVQGKIE